MSLKEATAELHSKAEKMPFNQKMFNGELTNEEYVNYLIQQYLIFKQIEFGCELPNESLKREEKILEDIKEINQNEFVFEAPATKQYVNYLSNLTNERLLSHVYLNYLALAYGGQMMKSKVPGSGKMYDFENMMECIGSIRAIQKDEWADEVNNGFQYMINILDELQEYSGRSSQ
jgi:heme oxygenase